MPSGCFVANGQFVLHRNVGNRGKAGRRSFLTQGDGKTGDILVAAGSLEFFRVETDDIGAMVIQGAGQLCQKLGLVLSRQNDAMGDAARRATINLS